MNHLIKAHKLTTLIFPIIRTEWNLSSKPFKLSLILHSLSNINFMLVPCHLKSRAVQVDEALWNFDCNRHIVIELNETRLLCWIDASDRENAFGRVYSLRLTKLTIVIFIGLHFAMDVKKMNENHYCWLRFAHSLRVKMF